MWLGMCRSGVSAFEPSRRRTVFVYWGMDSGSRRVADRVMADLAGLLIHVFFRGVDALRKHPDVLNTLQTQRLRISQLAAAAAEIDPAAANASLPLC